MATGSDETPLQVAVIEDQEKIRDGLRILIDRTPGFRCLAACHDMEHALDLFARATPRVALVDIGLPGISGIEGTRLLKERFPELQVIILTVYDDDDRVFRALCAGASGYLLKNTPYARLMEGIREVAKGGSPVSPEIARRIIVLFQKVSAPEHGARDLTPHETRILKLLVVQGSKHVLLGDKDLSYGPGQSLLTTIDLPVSYHTTRATATEPYLGIMLNFDRNLITQVASKIEAERPGKNEALEPIWIQRLDAPVLDAFHRLISLLDEPVVNPQIAALIQQEIIIRLLTGTHAAYLRNLVNAASPTQRVARAISWIRQNLAEEMRVGDLAEHANMSLTTFRERFRSVTGMSPVQFQKMLRLQEARQLMLDQNMSAGRASALVGYESASQFNREYRRLFGAPPQTDIRRMQAR